MTGGAHWSDEAHIDPVGVTERVLQKAEANGARLLCPAEVTGLDLAGGTLRAVRTSVGEIEADALVVACGVDTPRVAGLAGVRVPLKDSPGILVHVPPQPRLVQRVILAPMGNIKQKPDGRIVAGSDFGSGGGDLSREAGERLLKSMAAVLPELGRAGVEKMTQGFRPMPADGLPIVGFPSARRDLYLAVMHSGVTLGPLMGRLAAAEILDGTRRGPACGLPPRTLSGVDRKRRQRRRQKAEDHKAKGTTSAIAREIRFLPSAICFQLPFAFCPRRLSLPTPAGARAALSARGESRSRP